MKKQSPLKLRSHSGEFSFLLVKIRHSMKLKSYVDEDENQIKKAIDVLIELKLIETAESSASDSGRNKNRNNGRN